MVYSNDDSKTYYRCRPFPNNNNCNDLLLEEYYAVSAVSTGGVDFELFRVLLSGNIMDSPAVCQSFIDAILCFYEFQPCRSSDNNMSELLPICIERCPEIQQAYDFCLEDITLIIPAGFPALLEIIENFNCTDPRSYYANGERDLDISDTYCSKLLCSCSVNRELVGIMSKFFLV